MNCISFSFNSGCTNPTVILTTPEKTVEQVEFIDSGADAYLTDVHLAEQLNLKMLPLKKTLEATALDGQHLCFVTYHTTFVKVAFLDHHLEMIGFHL